MTLAVDIGNTNIVIGGFVQNEFQFIERISTNRQATTLEFSVSIRTILQLHDVDASAIDGAILSSVVPSLTTVLSHLNINVHTGEYGYYITDGKAIPIIWEKDGEFGVTHYYDQDHKEIVLNQGKTWVCIIPTKDFDKSVIN